MSAYRSVEDRTATHVRVIERALSPKPTEAELRDMAAVVNTEWRHPGAPVTMAGATPCARCGVVADRHVFLGCNGWRAA